MVQSRCFHIRSISVLYKFSNPLQNHKQMINVIYQFAGDIGLGLTLLLPIVFSVKWLADQVI